MHGTCHMCRVGSAAPVAKAVPIIRSPLYTGESPESQHVNSGTPPTPRLCSCCRPRAPATPRANGTTTHGCEHPGGGSRGAANTHATPGPDEADAGTLASYWWCRTTGGDRGVADSSGCTSFSPDTCTDDALPCRRPTVSVVWCQLAQMARPETHRVKYTSRLTLMPSTTHGKQGVDTERGHRCWILP